MTSTPQVVAALAGRFAGGAYPGAVRTLLRRRRRIGPVVGPLVIATSALLALYGFAAAINAYNLHQANGPMRDATNTFLRQIESGEYDVAYDSMCASARPDVGRAEFASRVGGPPTLADHQILATSLTTFKHGGPRYEVRVRLRYSDTSSQTRTIRVIQDGRTWQVCGYPAGTG